MNKNYIYLKSIIPNECKSKILFNLNKNSNINHLVNLLSLEFNIDCISDSDIVNGYTNDWSNMNGYADVLCRPKNEYECALILRSCQEAKIPITISAGRTNLNGSATPLGGLILSVENLTRPLIQVDNINKTISSPPGIYLEEMRKEALKLTSNTLYYPVDPTSRGEAMVGGTVSCNASGFIPGPEGATRYWTEGFDFLTLSGYKLTCKRGQYISNNGNFILKFDDKEQILKIPSYPRPNIKNASGPYSDSNGQIDFVDLIVGSEGIFGLLTKILFRLKDNPDGYLDLFIPLNNEEDAIKFHNYISKYFNGNLSKISALEYFGYNCQNYMKNHEYFFKSTKEVGIYFQIPLYNDAIEDVAEKWLKILVNSNCGINEDRIILLTDQQSWRMFFEARHSIPVKALEKSKNFNTLSILTDTIVPSNNFPQFLNLVHTELRKFQIEYLLFGHLGDCHLHFHLIPNSDQEDQALSVYDYIINKATQLGGVYSAEHGTGKRKRSDFIKCYGLDAVKSIKITKSVFDPDFLLNVGNVINNE